MHGSMEDMWFYHLHLVSSKDTIQDEVSPEDRPFTFNVLKQLELSRIVVQTSWVLVKQQPKASSSNYTIHSLINDALI